MISLHTYLVYCLVITLLAFAPGPNMILMLDYGLRYPFRTALIAIPGLLLGLFFYLMLAITGLYHLIAFAPTVFKILRLLGGCYLIYLGLRNFQRVFISTTINASISSSASQNLFLNGLFCCLTNPKVFVIYLAVLPQFINHDQAIIPQFLILGCTHISVLAIAATTYCYFANLASQYLTRYSRILSLCVGTSLTILGLSVFFLP